MQIVDIPIHKINYINSNNIRFELGDIEELVKSIHSRGILEPVLVREERDGEPDSTYKYRVLDGYRRCNAAAQLHIETVPCVVLPISAESDALALSLAANIHTASLSVLEEASVVHKLKNVYKLNVAQIVELVSLPHDRVQQMLAVMGYPEIIRLALNSGAITLGHARELSRLPIDHVTPFAQRVIDEPCSVKKLRKLVDTYLAKLATPAKDDAPTAGPSQAELDKTDQDIRDLQKQRRADLRAILVKLSRMYRPRSEHEVEHIAFGNISDDTIFTLLTLLHTVPVTRAEIDTVIYRIDNPDDADDVVEDDSSTATLSFWGGVESEAYRQYQKIIEELDDSVELEDLIVEINEIAKARTGSGRSVKINKKDIAELAARYDISLEDLDSDGTDEDYEDTTVEPEEHVVFRRTFTGKGNPEDDDE